MEGLKPPEKEENRIEQPVVSQEKNKYDAVAEQRLQKISGFFSGVTDRMKKGAIFALGAPERVGDKMNEAWEGTKDRIGQAREGLKARWEQGKQNTTERLQATKDKAKLWGLGVAASVEDRVVGIWNAPKVLALEAGANRAGARAEQDKMRQGGATLAYGSEIARLEARIAQLKELVQAEVATHKDSQEQSTAEMWEKLLAAKERRERVGYARQALSSLQQKAA